MDIFEALKESHERQRSLLEELQNTSGDTAERRKLWGELQGELQNHAAAEERYFYRPMMEHDESMARARHSVHEHQEIDEKIEEIRASDFDSSGWLTLIKALAELVDHHLDEEEHGVFQVAGKVLKEGQKSDLGKDYRQEMARLRSSV